MKLRELISRVDKDKSISEKIYIADMAEKLSIPEVYEWSESDRLIAYWIGDWYCTDTRVGYKVYFFDGEPVAASLQMGRKCDEKIEWLSKEAYDNVFKYILNFLLIETRECEIADMDEEVGDSYKISYFEQMFEHNKKNARYNGESVTVKSHKRSYNDDKGFHFEQVMIENADGSTVWVPTVQLEFPYNIKK